jgi:hypothetical protein
MNIYISGKVTGDKHYKKKFTAAKNTLEENGYKVFNPANDIEPLKGATWEEYMKTAIINMLLCDGVAMLPDRGESKGATLESYIASRLGIKKLPLELWGKLQKKGKRK